MTSVATLLLLAGVSGQPTPSCGSSVLPVELSVVRAPIQERHDLSLDQIEALRRASGTVPAHRTFGLYAVKVFYTIDGVPASTRGCGPIARVNLVLSERIIQLARDIAPGACQAAAVAHYRMHAEINDAVFSHLADRVAAVLRTPAVAAALWTARTSGEIQDLIEALVGPEMDAYDRENRAAQVEGDSIGQRERLERPCNDPH